jgi:hypothetical protein
MLPLPLAKEHRGLTHEVRIQDQGVFPYLRAEPEFFATERAAQCDLLRDLFANPFRPPPPLDPAVLAWQEATVVRLARAAYDERELPSGYFDPDGLAVLADALEEAGADAELVAHLRDPGPHYRGCHVVDLILGRS